NGKPLWEATAVDIALTIEIFRYYAGWTTKLAGEVLPNSIPGMLTLGVREPVGVVGAITPWNFPLLEVAYKLGPGLAAGCTMVVKPSELAPMSTLRLMELVHEAGFPPGVVNVVIGGPEVGEALVRHPGVSKIAFTGQTATGKQIMRAAVDDLKRVTLELGGKSPNIVFADADLHVAQEEIFGPVLSVIPWEDEDELRALANGVDYGLAAGIWTRDTSKALRLASDLQAGTVWINTYGMFDVAVPFGGRKHSGFGRELGQEALEPYLQSKSIWVDLTSAVPQSGQGIGR